MKRYGNLFDSVCSLDNLRLADDKARKGKKSSYGVRLHDKHREDNLLRLRQALLDGTFRTSPYKTMTIHEPKERLIYKLPYYPDRIVHHAIVNVVEPIWKATFTDDTYACIKGRGLHACAWSLRHDLRANPKDTVYCLKTDIRKYYPSIDHEIMKQIVRRKIKDARLLALLDDIIDSEDGLPIGNYLSQHLANLYLTGFDHRMKEIHGVRHYYRYVDDMVFLAPTKEELRDIIATVREELKLLRLELKDDWQIFPVDDRGIDFLGYRFFHGYALLRKSMKKTIFKKLSRLRHGLIRQDTWRRSFASWHGWLLWCDAFRLENTILNNLKLITT